MKRILYLGYLVKPEEAETLSGASIAGNKMQWNIVTELSRKKDVKIYCITISSIAPFPKDKKIFQRYECVQLTPDIITHKVPFINVPIIKQLCQLIEVYRFANKLISKYAIDYVLSYNMYPAIGFTMKSLHRKNSHEPVCLLADLPIDYLTNRKGISAWLWERMANATWKNMSICERYIVLNKYVIDRYLKEKEYIVIDGGVSSQDIDRTVSRDIIRKQEKNILFGGALTDYNGLINMIEAIQLINRNDVFLDIYGSGPLEEFVRANSKKDKRIRFHGKVSNDCLMKKQQKAWLLINPRKVDDLISKVTFPSKTFEYLLSGTPVLSTKLNGYSQEYDEIMFFCGNGSKEEIAKSIEEIIEMNQNKLIAVAEKARQFVINNRSWEKQTDRILKFICDD